MLFEMNIKTKKIIAREFLLLLLSIAIAIFTFLFIYFYNYFEQIQIDSFKKDISVKKSISDSLSKSYTQKSEKQFWFTNKYASKFDISINGDYTNAKLWNRLYEIAKSDSMKFIWENSWPKELITFIKELGFETPEIFQSFILNNMLNSKDLEKDREAQKINLETELLETKIDESYNKIVIPENQIRTAWVSFIIAIIVLFFLRYVFFGIKWSIKTLKQS
jgi:hypothetical protein